MKIILQAAQDIIEKYHSKKHQVGAALRTKSGNIYTGVSCSSQKVDICAEWIAVGKAISEGDTDIEIIVAVRREDDGSVEVLAPCALCRDLGITYYPDAQVILSETETIRAADLLPRPYLKNHSRK